MSGSVITNHFSSRKGPRIAKLETRSPDASNAKAAPKLSQKELDLQELKDFDLQWEFGPCTGISRMERWHRAERNELNPPARIKEIIMKNINDASYTQRQVFTSLPLQ